MLRILQRSLVRLPPWGDLDIEELVEGSEASFDFYDHQVIGPDGGSGGHIEVYEPCIYAPEGFVADDLYAVEFILDPTTGELTTNLYFSKGPSRS